MATTPPVPRPTWTRRVPGWSFLLFFVSLIVLTYLAVDFWNRGDLVTTGYFAGLASVVPILLVALVYYGRPLWAIHVPLEPVVVSRVVSQAAANRRMHTVAEREGPFASCVSVARFDRPACTIGWAELPTAPGAKAPRERTVLILRPEARDRKAVAAFRDALAESLLRAGSAAA
jgi:hypothetical protein